MPTYSLSITEYNRYTKTIEAADPDAAIAKAQELWEAEGPDAFDWCNGAIEDWECSPDQDFEVLRGDLNPEHRGSQQ